MRRLYGWLLLWVLGCAGSLGAAERTVVEGPITVRPLYHGTVWLTIRARERTWHIVVDPWKRAPLPRDRKAHLILITDIHFDHMDPDAIRMIAGTATEIVAPKAVANAIQSRFPQMRFHVIANGESMTWRGIRIDAVPMYNTAPERLQYHPKGRGNGYVIAYQGHRVYIAGDTQCTSEMKALQDIDVALIPINLPYTMDAEEAAECVRAFRPKRVIPYHYQVGQADPDRFEQLLQNEPGIQVVRILDGKTSP